MSKSYQGAAEAVLSYQEGGYTGSGSGAGAGVDGSTDSDGSALRESAVHATDEALEEFRAALDAELSDAELREVADEDRLVKTEAFRKAERVLQRDEFRDPDGDGPRVVGSSPIADRAAFLREEAQTVLDEKAARERRSAQRRSAQADGGVQQRQQARQQHHQRVQARQQQIQQSQTIGGLNETQTIVLVLVVLGVLLMWSG